METSEITHWGCDVSAMGTNVGMLCCAGEECEDAGEGREGTVVEEVILVETGRFGGTAAFGLDTFAARVLSPLVEPRHKDLRCCCGNESTRCSSHRTRSRSFPCCVPICALYQLCSSDGAREQTLDTSSEIGLRDSSKSSLRYFLARIALIYPKLSVKTYKELFIRTEESCTTGIWPISSISCTTGARTSV